MICCLGVLYLLPLIASIPPSLVYICIYVNLFSPAQDQIDACCKSADLHIRPGDRRVISLDDSVLQPK